MKILDKLTEIILINGFKEMNEKYSKYFSAMSRKKMLQVDPLIQLSICKDDNSEIIQCLNQKEIG